MTAAQAELVSSHRSHALAPTTGTFDFVTNALASYSYPEVFFEWRSVDTLAAATFYVRADRYPHWIPDDLPPSGFPVASFVKPSISRQLLDRIEQDALLGRNYSIFDVTIGTSTYQVVTLLTFANPYRDRLTSVLGFMVDLAWVREHYISSLTTLVARMSDATSGTPLIVGEPPATPGSSVPQATGYKMVPLAFFDPRLVAADWPADLARNTLTVHASVSNDPVLDEVLVGARRTRVIVFAFALAPVIGLILTVRSERRRTALAELRSDFVSSVTHELKTPIATLRAISEIFATDRGITPDLSQKHGRLALHEAKRLTRLVDNLLAYARMTDVTEAYDVQALSVQTLVEQTIAEFQSQLEFLRFNLEVDVPDDLPPIRADHTAMVLVLGNLLENAVRYSPHNRSLRITARGTPTTVAIEIVDHGIGISDDDLPHITKRFIRGHRGSNDGTGLGLAIVDRIVSDHRGTLTIRSRAGIGTTVIVELPVAIG